MATVSFAGVVLKNWQTPKRSLTRDVKESDLVSEMIHAARSSKVRQFPKTFLCYADTAAEMNMVEALINTDYSTLVVNGTSFLNCYVYQISDIWEMVEGSGKWKYSIEFRQADVHD